MLSSVAILYSVTVDRMYLVEALILGLPGADIPSDFLHQAIDFLKWATVATTLSWCAIMAVKFSFLYLFRKLIDRIKPLIIYWWVVTAFNVVALGYGVIVYYVACNYYHDPRICMSTWCPWLFNTDLVVSSMHHAIGRSQNYASFGSPIDLGSPG